MVPKNGNHHPSISVMFLSFTLLCTLSLSLFFLFTSPHNNHKPSSSSLKSTISPPPHSSSLNPIINVYLANLPRSLNYGLLDNYWSLTGDSRLGSNEDRKIRSTLFSKGKTLDFPPYPKSPLIKQYSAEYWITGDLMTPEEMRTGSLARRVLDAGDADVVFVPFFATMSAELQLTKAKGLFRKTVGNEDYERQRMVVDFVKGTEAWKRSGGRDHVFVLTGFVKT